MIRQIQTENVRAHELSDRAVPCPGALDHDTQSRYGAKSRTGSWVTYREMDETGDTRTIRCGRALGRVDAPYVPHDRYPCERIDGHISVLVLSDNMQHAYIRWVNPAHVIEVSSTPPAGLLAWVTQPTLPDARIVHDLSNYGTLSERYIDKVDDRIVAFKAGVSPAAYSCGVRGGSK